MITRDRAAAVQALTESGRRRDRLLGRSHSLTDEDLIRDLARRAVSQERLQLLVQLSKLLRLMHGLLTGLETGEGFVEKFSQGWLRVTDWSVDPGLEKELVSLNRFYERIQRFCAIPDHLTEESLLFGVGRLLELTRETYDQSRGVWYHCILGAEAESINVDVCD